MEEPSRTAAPPTAARLARRIDLLLWRAFGHGSLLRAPRRRTSVGLLTSVLAALGVSLPR